MLAFSHFLEKNPNLEAKCTECHGTVPVMLMSMWLTAYKSILYVVLNYDPMSSRFSLFSIFSIDQSGCGEIVTNCEIPSFYTNLEHDSITLCQCLSFPFP